MKTTVKNILTKTNFTGVYDAFSKHYDVKHVQKIKTIYESLCRSCVSKNHNSSTIIIKAYTEHEDDEVVELQNFDFENEDVCFDVYCTTNDYEGIYSIASMEYPILLSSYVQKGVSGTYTPAQIIALILWELDW